MEVARSFSLTLFRATTVGIFLLPLWLHSSSSAQLGSNRQQSPDTQGQSNQSSDEVFSNIDRHAEDEFRQGTALTGKGAFKEAIPHLLAAQGKVSNAYAAGFNLALCYVATASPSLPSKF